MITKLILILMLFYSFCFCGIKVDYGYIDFDCVSFHESHGRIPFIIILIVIVSISLVANA